MENRDRNRGVASNSYLTGLNTTRPARLTLSSELKRLCGKPQRILATLFLVILPLLAALAGALDLLSAWLYTISHHTTADTRKSVLIFECLNTRTKGMCQGLVWASPASPKRLVLYPWHDVELLHPLEPFVFIGYFAVAVLAFAAIGNPNATRILQTLRTVAGLAKTSTREKANAEDKENTRVERLLAGKVQRTELGLYVFSSEEIGETLAKVTAKGHIKKGTNSKLQLKPGQPVKTLIPLLATASDTDTLVPCALLDLDQPAEFWKNHLLLGGYLPRNWEENPGYFWYDRTARPVPYWLSLSVLRTGLLIVAPPGSGKTVSIFKPLRTFLARSGSVGIFYDVKSSENTDGSGTDFPAHLFTLNFDAARANPEGSIKLNVFAGQTPAQAGERLAEALIPDLAGDKAYFSNNAKSAMSTIVASYHAIYSRYPTLIEILNFLTNPAKLEALNELVVEKLTGPRYEEGLRLTTLLRRVINLSGNKGTDTLGNLATALEPLVTDVAARLLVTNPGPNAYTVEDLLEKPGLIRLALPVANNPRIYPIIGRLVLAQFTYAVLSPQCNRNLFKLIAVDEARFFITDNVANGMAQARSNNAGFALSFQTLTQIRDEALLDNIFANAGSKLVMGKVSDKDAERYGRLFGTIELPYISHSASENQGKNKNAGRSHSRGSEFEMFSSGDSGRESRASRSTSNGTSSSSGQSQGVSLTTRPRHRFLNSEVRELEQRHAIIESSDDQGKQWFAQVINLDALIVQKLEQQVEEQITELVKKSNKSKSKSFMSEKSKFQTSQDLEAKVESPEDKISSPAVGTQSDNFLVVDLLHIETEPVTRPTIRPRIRIIVTSSPDIVSPGTALPVTSAQVNQVETSLSITSVPNSGLVEPVNLINSSSQPVCRWCGSGGEKGKVSEGDGKGMGYEALVRVSGIHEDGKREHEHAYCANTIKQKQDHSLQSGTEVKEKSPEPEPVIATLANDSQLGNSEAPKVLTSVRYQEEQKAEQETGMEIEMRQKSKRSKVTSSYQRDIDNSEGTAKIGDEFEQIKLYLVSVGLHPDQVEVTADLVLANQRTISDLERLADYARGKNPEQAGAYILAMIKKNRYPAAKPARKPKEPSNPDLDPT